MAVRQLPKPPSTFAGLFVRLDFELSLCDSQCAFGDTLFFGCVGDIICIFRPALEEFGKPCNRLCCPWRSLLGIIDKACLDADRGRTVPGKGAIQRSRECESRGRNRVIGLDDANRLALSNG